MYGNVDREIRNLAKLSENGVGVGFGQGLEQEPNVSRECRGKLEHGEGRWIARVFAGKRQWKIKKKERERLG